MFRHFIFATTLLTLCSSIRRSQSSTACGNGEKILYHAVEKCHKVNQPKLIVIAYVSARILLLIDVAHDKILNSFVKMIRFPRVSNPILHFEDESHQSGFEGWH